jgi:N-acetylmuramoyl-L-alanine amidase
MAPVGIAAPVLLILAAALFAGCGEEAVTQDPEPPTAVQGSTPFATVVVTGSVVNLRAGPGTAYAVVGTVAAGDTLRVTGGTDEWFSVYLPSRSLFAWVYAGLTSGAELP